MPKRDPWTTRSSQRPNLHAPGKDFEPILRSSGNPFQAFWVIFSTSLFDMIFESIFGRLWFDFEINFETFFGHCVAAVDFVKIVLPCRREPQSGGSGSFKKVTF